MRKFILALFSGRHPKRRGQTLVEYAMILSCITLVAISLLYALGQQTTNFYSGISSNLNQISSTTH